MTIKRIFVGNLITNCYLLIFSDRIAVVDPGDHPEKILSACGDLPVTDVILTHGHLDHVAALRRICDRFSPRVWMHPEDEKFLNEDALRAPGMPKEAHWQYDYAATDFVGEGDEITVGPKEDSLGLIVLHTPGHTPGSICLYSEEQKILFAGDTLFKGTCGRTDFPLGSMEQMRKSLHKLSELPGDTAVFPGHGFGTTVGAEGWIAEDRI